jgi:hypothetical protein
MTIDDLELVVGYIIKFALSNKKREREKSSANV